MDDLLDTNLSWNEFDDCLLAIELLPPFGRKLLRERLEAEHPDWFDKHDDD
jgi:hypothetical protein